MLQHLIRVVHHGFTQECAMASPASTSPSVMELLPALRRLALFAKVPDALIVQFLRDVRVKRLDPGVTLFTAHDPHDRLYLLLAGVVKTYVITGKGMAQITNLFYPGDAFGGLMFGRQQNPRPWAQALDAVTLVDLREAEFQAMMTTHPQVCMNIFHYMAEHHQRHIRRLQTLLHTRSGHRLVLTLLALGDRQGDSECEEFKIGHGFTHDDLANMIGVVRSTASELMGDLRRAGVVRGNGRAIVVNRTMAYHFLSCDPDCECAGAAPVA